MSAGDALAAEAPRADATGLVPPEGLFISGLAPLDGGTAVLLSPNGAAFWAALTASPEWRDGGPDPVDRWSVRVIGAFATACGGRAVFPFGPGAADFLGLARRSGRAWVSPVGMLVHDVMGLWCSYRGAVLLPQPCPSQPPADPPCARCPARPCLSACPVGALGGAAGYDLAACHGWLDRPQGRDCMAAGCRARRACPAGAGYGRLPAQSAHHMRHFHP